MYPSNVGGCWLNSTIYTNWTAKEEDKFPAKEEDKFPTKEGFFLFYKETISAESGYPEDAGRTRQVYSTIYLPNKQALQVYLEDNEISEFGKEEYRVFQCKPVNIEKKLSISID